MSSCYILDIHLNLHTSRIIQFMTVTVAASGVVGEYFGRPLILVGVLDEENLN